MSESPEDRAVDRLIVDIEKMQEALEGVADEIDRLLASGERPTSKQAKLWLGGLHAAKTLLERGVRLVDSPDVPTLVVLRISPVLDSFKQTMQRNLAAITQLRQQIES